MTLHELENLEAARAALEQQRPTLGDAVVEAALRPIEQKLTALRNASAAEQLKPVAVLFADVAGFTSLSERRDPEDVREIIDAYFGRWTTEIDRYGGRVEKFIGDAVVAAFGVAVIQEDDTERAVLAALAMRDALTDLNQELQETHGEALTMRVGIATGPTLVSLVGDRYQDFVLVGDTVNVASRLQTVAPDNGILISGDAAALTRGRFELESVPPLELKGKSEPVVAYVVRGLGRSAFASGESAGPLVGRGVELGALHSALAEVVSSGRPRLVVVVADAGLGKSRLLVEFEHALGAAPEPTSRFTAKATSETTTLPYGLLRALVTERLGLADTDPLEEVQERLRSLAGIDEPLRAVRVGRLLGFEITAEGVDPKEVYEGGLGDLVSMLERAATGQAAVVLLEDIHWADEASLDVIDHLLDSVDGPLLVVASARPTIMERRSRWRDDPRTTWMDLAPLGSAEAGTLLGALLPGGAVSQPVADMVHAAAQGNPYYLEELARMLADTGAVRLQRGEYLLDWDRMDPVGVPTTLTGVLHARIDAVPAGERDVLDRAAVVGRTFWDAAVEHLADRPTGADSDLSALAGRSMVVRRNRSQFGGTAEYDFDHGLLRDATYQALLRRRRSTYHARAAGWLEEVTAASGRSDEFSGQIARHHAEAGAGEEAAAWYLRAADRAAGQYANEEAIHFLDLAIALIPVEAPEELWGAVERRERLHGVIGLREAQSRDLEMMTEIAEALDDMGRRAEAALRDADQAERMGEYERAIGDANRAMAWARDDGDVEREVRSLRQLAAVRWRTGDLAGARRVIDEGLDLAKRNGLDEWEGRLLRNWGMVEEHLGDYAAAERHYQGALERARRRADRREVALGLNDLGIAAYYLGDLLKALRLEEEALAMRVEMGDRVGEATVLNNLALTTGAIGDFAASRDLFSRTMEIAEDVGDAEGVAASIQGLGVMTSRLGAIDDARSLLEDATQRYQDLGDPQGTSQCLEELGWAALASNQAPEALILADRAMELARDGGFSPEEANGRRLRGRVLASLGRPAEAVEALRRAATDQAAIGNEPFAVSARAWLAVALHALGDKAEAHSIAAESLTGLLALDGTGVDDPVGAYLACAEVLVATDDPRSEEALAAARRLMERRSALIKDDDERVRFQEFHRRRLP